MDSPLSEYLEQAEELLEISEDFVEYFCSEYKVSGQRAWTMLHALADCKVSEFPTY